MSLYKVKTKYRKCCNGVNIEAGMEVQVVTPMNNTIQVTIGSMSKMLLCESLAFRSERPVA